MPETIVGDIYDYPKYYDIVYGSDWRAEFDFLEDIFETCTDRVIKRVFEPACGTGRLLVKLAEAGYEVSGLDLNEKMIKYCNSRLAKHGQPESSWVGDMTDFRMRRKADAAFNMINSFRHLSSEKGAVDHLRCMAGALAKGGLYVLGLHLTPTKGERMEEESWSARRGNLAVVSHLWTEEIDFRRRQERVGMSYDIYTPTRQFRLTSEVFFRTYKWPQFRQLLSKVPEFEIAEVYDFAYDIERPVKIDAKTEDVVFVLRKV